MKDLERNFLCEVIEDLNNNNSNSSNSLTSYDLVLEMSVENDDVVFNGLKFPLKSFDRKTGSGSHTINASWGTATLNLSNGFETVYFFRNNSSSNGSSSYVTITGTSTENSITSATNNSFDEQEGDYSLFSQTIDYSNGINTSQMGTYSVSYDPAGRNLIKDGTSYELPVFYSRYKRTHNVSASGIYHDYQTNSA